MPSQQKSKLFQFGGQPYIIVTFLALSQPPVHLSKFSFLVTLAVFLYD